jgi:hypothetical protein
MGCPSGYHGHVEWASNKGFQNKNKTGMRKQKHCLTKTKRKPRYTQSTAAGRIEKNGRRFQRKSIEHSGKNVRGGV